MRSKSIGSGVYHSGIPNPTAHTLTPTQRATQLRWGGSSTRLLLHFADNPCHNKHYHDGIVSDNYATDPYPSGT